MFEKSKKSVSAFVQFIGITVTSLILGHGPEIIKHWNLYKLVPWSPQVQAPRLTRTAWEGHLVH